ncbi:hypothetical protein MCAP1_000356 [Malassezia caprae]|uniref:Uncharacterized protein n=1 Tax=Malassezia caprae TaxID=1381934 RepID=A0AAF0E4R2_9BASI|nr:hypothetical protein MCAP1_000356 [Malassezia caprae]
MRTVTARPRWQAVPRLLRALHTPSEKPSWDLRGDTDDKNAAPTLEALDFLRPTAHRHKRMDSPSALWARTFNRINDSFTRPQLYQLARDAKLEDVRASMPKAQLVKAFMEQRFELSDPNAPIQTVSTFLPLAISDVFLLSCESRPFFDILRRAQANATMDKRDLQTGVTISGLPRAIEQVRAWLDTFQQSIQTMRVPLDASDEFLLWISYHTQCHARKDGEEVRLRYLNQEQADHARMLLEEQSHTRVNEAHHSWLLSPEEAGESPFLSSLPFSPGTAVEPLTCYTLQKGTWSRLVASDTDAPLHMVPVSQTTAEFPVHLPETSDKTSCIPASLVDGEWTQNTHTSFGHLLWDQVPADLGTIPSVESPGLFLAAAPPSCMDHSPTMIDWTELEYDEQELERFYYRVALDQGAVDLVLTLGAQGAPTWQSATWMCHAETHVLCPTLPVDMRVTLSKEAPLRLSALEGTLLASYLEQVSLSRAAEGGTCGLEVLEQVESSPKPSMPLHLQLSSPEGTVSLHLWRTEQMTQRSSTYYHPEHTDQLTLHRQTRRCNSMHSFCTTVNMSMPTWPGVETVQALLQSPYPALGRQR